MAQDITVQLFPPTPAGMQGATGPRGDVLIPVPMYEYTGVREIQHHQHGGVSELAFTNRRGEAHTHYLAIHHQD